MPSLLDLQRVALRIEGLQRQSTHDWLPGDDLEFKASLPEGTDRRALPDPKWLREQAADPEKAKAITVAQWQTWTATLLRLDSLVSRNRPGSSRRMLHDMQRGKIPPRGW